MPYPLNIPGVLLYRKSSYSRHLVLHPDTARSSVALLVADLPPDSSLSFYDRHFPSPSDPGAYVSFRRSGSGYEVMKGNHGWSSGWEPIEHEDLIEYFWASKAFNLGADPDEVMWLDKNWATPGPTESVG